MSQNPISNREMHEQNRRSWNAATVAHNSHKGDQARFFREGGDTLCEEELELLGELAGKRVLHMQCNAGQDTLSLARRGAIATGVDISDEAIAFARRLSEESGIAAAFERSDLYDWLAAAAQRGEMFDIAFCSYGAICWLSDLKRWARGVAGVLRPGGRFVTVEFHPVAMMFEPSLERKWSYFRREPWHWPDGVADYVARSGAGLAPGEYHAGVVDFQNPHPVYEFQWTIADILTALLEAGLRIEIFREYPYSNGCRLFDATVADADGRQQFPPEVPAFPQMYAVAARKGEGSQ